MKKPLMLSMIGAALLMASLPGLASSSQSKTIIVAGDIAQCTDASNEAATAQIVSGLPGLVMTAGDNAYPDGTLEEFQACYDPTWGAFRTRTRPAPGNHDYKTPGAAGYFEYFGSRAGPPGRGYYSFKAGSWRVYSLSGTQCVDDGCDQGSAQYRWLKKKLASKPSRCVLAVWHEPRFSSGVHGNTPEVQPLFKLLYAAGAEVIINGHDHDYERLAPVRPSGRKDLKFGIRQFVVGTGGAELRGAGAREAPRSKVFESSTHGVMRLTLRLRSYRWKFIPVEGSTFTDAGKGTCHGKRTAG